MLKYCLVERNIERLVSIMLVLLIFYFGFMNLDRILSLVYGFNFQPYGEYVPSGFTLWGHLANGSGAAAGLYLTFKLDEIGRKRGNRLIQYIGYVIYGVIGAYIPYMNDAEHLANHGAWDTLIPYLIANDLYVFGLGYLAYRTADTNRKRMMAVIVLAFFFLVIHFLFYAPRFPEFYWS